MRAKKLNEAYKRSYLMTNAYTQQYSINCKKWSKMLGMCTKIPRTAAKIMPQEVTHFCAVAEIIF